MTAERHMADLVRLVRDEDGWHLIVETTDAGRFDFHAHGVALEVDAGTEHGRREVRDAVDAALAGLATAQLPILRR